MWFVSVIAVGLGVLFAVLVGRQAMALQRECYGARDLLARQRSARREAATFRASRESIAKATDSTTSVVSSTAALTRTGHMAISTIPFGIFRAIPRTAPAARRMQQLHDDVADAVYQTIGNVAETARRSANDRLLGAEPTTELEQAPPTSPDAGESDPLEPPTPPSARPD